MTSSTHLDERGETFFLNLRFMLIVTVIAGNAIEPLITSSSAMHGLFTWIFSFHMPLFVLVTGYFARLSLTGEAGRRVLAQIGLQYVIFQSLYSVLDACFFQVAHIHRSFFAPYLLLWFLASHACWRLLLLAVRRWNPLWQLAAAAAAGVLVGYLPLDGVWLSVSRTFVYLPYFVAGYHLPFSAVARFLRGSRRRIAALLSLALLVLFMAGALPMPSPGWLYGSMTFGELGTAHGYAGLYRLGMYGLQVLSAAAFLGWVPYAASAMTDWGRRTLYVFLLHGLVIRFAVVSGIYAHLDRPGGYAAVLAASLSLAVILAQKQVRACLHVAVEPQVGWLWNLRQRLASAEAKQGPLPRLSAQPGRPRSR
ncbi:acyltransferase family protein [Paenibacillus glufosinatiresistens]|uniref:acyltransferase family protein n=1 Tax=Paenibacillus glufosinatiresistens TaxID=3070657 RepID=UPI00286D8480|nr:fucose 4-O-acetylase [Paenibacillus sp. YX.27]